MECWIRVFAGIMKLDNLNMKELTWLPSAYPKLRFGGGLLVSFGDPGLVLQYMKYIDFR